jgi:imidazolonepropionase-like amidohydrolase
MCAVLDGDVPMIVTAHRAQDIASALRLAREFRFRLVLDGASEAYLLLDELAAAGVPVILHPTMKRASGDAENLSFETAARLSEAGIPFAIKSGYESYVPKTRVILFEAAVAASHGLGFEGALRSVTIDAARILGVEDRVGSLEVGKDGDLARNRHRGRRGLQVRARSTRCRPPQPLPEAGPLGPCCPGLTGSA